MIDLQKIDDHLTSFADALEQLGNDGEISIGTFSLHAAPIAHDLRYLLAILQLQSRHISQHHGVKAESFSGKAN